MNAVAKSAPEGAQAAAPTGPATAAETAIKPETQPPRRRGRGRLIALMLAVPLALAGGAAAWWYAGGQYQSTENANLHLARVAVAPTIGGRVVAVAVHELQRVKAGDMLFRVDPEPFRIALAEAEAALQGARLQVEQMKAAHAEAVAAADLAHTDADYLTRELARQESLTDRGVATASKLDDARHAARQADDRAKVADLAVDATRAALGGAPDAETDAHPKVRAALAAVDRARYDLAATTVTAAADGVVYQSNAFRPGVMVAPGQPVFALVETDDLWVEANFKETQLTAMQPGQAAEVEFDIAPGRSFAGRVEAIGAGTGAEFSLLPAQNATGNWVKVTQRVPVRIRLDHPGDLAGLASGLSAAVTVDTGATRGLAWAAPAAN